MSNSKDRYLPVGPSLNLAGEAQVITKVSQIIQRSDGSEAKIVAQACDGVGLKRSIDVYVLWRESPQREWKLTSQSPHPAWRTMPVIDYIHHGRSEMLKTVSIGEILRLTNAIGKPMSYIGQEFAGSAFPSLEI